jgi:hypothetical protein
MAVWLKYDQHHIYGHMSGVGERQMYKSLKRGRREWRTEENCVICLLKRNTPTDEPKVGSSTLMVSFSYMRNKHWNYLPRHGVDPFPCRRENVRGGCGYLVQVSSTIYHMLWRLVKCTQSAVFCMKLSVYWVLTKCRCIPWITTYIAQ